MPSAIIVRNDWQAMLFHLKCSFVCINRYVLYVSFSQHCFLLTPTARPDCAESFWRQVEAWPLLTDMEYRYLTRKSQPRSFSTRYWVSIRYRWTAEWFRVRNNEEIELTKFEWADSNCICLRPYGSQQRNKKNCGRARTEGRGSVGKRRLLIGQLIYSHNSCMALFWFF